MERLKLQSVTPFKEQWTNVGRGILFPWCSLLNLQGCPKLSNRSQPLVGQSSPYYEDMWRGYCCLTIFFRLSIRALAAKIQPNKVVRWCRDDDFLLHFCVLYFQRAACSTFQTCILNLHEGHTMCRSMVDIRSATAEIRRGNKRKKKDRRRTTWQKYNGLPIP